MTFKVNVPVNSELSKDVLDIRNRILVQRFIVNYPFKASERLLDDYLRSTLKRGLRECCLEILFMLKSSTTTDGLIYTIINDYWDKVAQLITCGVANIPGSRILLDTLNCKNFN
jgi:hypothetical protein